jgi:hypothetical protein
MHGPSKDLDFPEACLDWNRIRPATSVKPSRKPVGQRLGIAPRSRATCQLSPSRLVKMRAGIKRAQAYLKPLPEPGQVLCGLLDGQFTGWMLIAAAVGLLACPVRLHIGSLNANLDTAQSIAGLIGKGIVTDCAVVLGGFWSRNSAEEAGQVSRILQEAGARVAVAESHAKLACIEPLDRPDRLTILGSQNLRSCLSLEAYVIMNDPTPFSFYRGILERLLKGKQP